MVESWNLEKLCSCCTCHMNNTIQFLLLLHCYWENIDCIINFRSPFLGSSEFLLWCLTLTDHGLVSPTVCHCFRNNENCSSFVVSFLRAPNKFMLELCHRSLVSLFHNYGTHQIATSTSHNLTTEVRDVHACWERPASLAPGVASDLNASATSNIIPCGKGQLMERRSLEQWTNFSPF
jgi:hypothetical protein